jgi:hypothetical protein
MPIIQKIARPTLQLITKIGGIHQRKMVRKTALIISPKSILNTINNTMAITSAAVECEL